MAPETHEERTERLDEQMQEVRRHLYGNGDVGLFETVRMIAKVQRWHTWALAILLLMQLGGSAGEVLRMFLRKVLTP